MKQFTRGAIVLALAVAAIVGLFAALVPLSNALIEQWARRDVELRSELVFNSIRDRVEREIAGQTQELIPFFERLTTDERIMALGLCDAQGRITVATPRMPRDLDCRIPPAAGAPESAARFTRVRIAGERVLIGVFPIAAAGQSAQLVILHELGFVADRIVEARWYLVMVGLALLLLFGAIATLAVGLLQRRYMRAVLSSIQDLKTGRPTRSRSVMDPRVQEESREIRGLLRDFREKIRQEDGTPVEWSPSTLQDLLEKELPDAEVFVVSNREPYIHNRDGDSIVVQRPASGLVSALEPVMRACGGIWVAHGSGSADRETVDREDHVAVPPGKPAYRLRRVWITDEEQEGYYYGLANEGLWPLCHLAYVRPIFRESRLAALCGGQPALRRRRGARGDAARPGHHGAGLSLRAAAADDPRAIAEGDDPHLLAHPMAERGGLRHLPVEGGDHRGPARLDRARLPHPGPLQQLLRDGGPVHGEPHRPRAPLGGLRRRGDDGPALSDLHRMAAGGPPVPAAGRDLPAGGARALRPLPPT
jgi:trehalose 6-phosphate synthase